MTDLEISKALALAIGWPEAEPYSWSVMVRERTGMGWRVFDYLDWNIAGPIAEKFDLFPYRDFHEKWTTDWTDGSADTPQKAIAMAVIGAKK